MWTTMVVIQVRVQQERGARQEVGQLTGQSVCSLTLCAQQPAADVGKYSSLMSCAFAHGVKENSPDGSILIAWAKGGK
jgi:hypothetical protein